MYEYTSKDVTLPRYIATKCDNIQQRYCANIFVPQKCKVFDSSPGDHISIIVAFEKEVGISSEAIRKSLEPPIKDVLRYHHQVAISRSTRVK